MATKTPTLHPEWVTPARDDFQAFLRVTTGPHAVRNGTRGRAVDDPEWLIMFMAIVSVKAHVKHDLVIYRLAVQHWDRRAEGLDGRTRMTPISEAQLRDRFKTSAMHLESLPRALFRTFLKKSSMEKGRAAKMMVKANAPVWHQNQTQQDCTPQGWRGLDREAMWGTSRADGWTDGHGTFSLTSHRRPMVGICQRMPNAGHESRRMDQAIITDEGRVKNIFMASKADDQPRYFRLTTDHRVQLITGLRKGMDTSASRKQMIKPMLTMQNTPDDHEQLTTGEPMQGRVAKTFERERCWMRRDAHNRWRCAAMGMAGQMAPWRAWTHTRSTWNVTLDVVGS